MSDQDRVEKLAETLTTCLAQLDDIGAHFAAAHVDSALHALRRQFSLPVEASVTD